MRKQEIVHSNYAWKKVFGAKTPYFSMPERNEISPQKMLKRNKKFSAPVKLCTQWTCCEAAENICQEFRRRFSAESKSLILKAIKFAFQMGKVLKTA